MCITRMWRSIKIFSAARNLVVLDGTNRSSLGQPLACNWVERSAMAVERGCDVDEFDKKDGDEGPGAGTVADGEDPGGGASKGLTFPRRAVPASMRRFSSPR